MPDYTLKYIFGGASAAIGIRADYISFSDKKRDLCRAFAIGFGLSTSKGDDIFTNGLSAYSLSNVTGFENNSIYDGYETNVKSIISSYARTSSLSNSNKTILAASVNAILFAYIGNPNINSSELIEPIGRVLYQITKLVIGDSEIFELNDEGVVIHPFTKTVIDSLFVQNNYTLIYQQLSTNPKEVEVDMVHYNYYDTTDLFSGPDLDKMKDAENQYYYLSGILTYDNLPTSGFAPCEEITTTINTPTGNALATFLRNVPCFDKDSYIGPVTGIKFNRTFNDGPYSSGDFTKTVRAAFINFDKSKLNKSQYSSNYSTLFLYGATGVSGASISLLDSNGKVKYDAEGEYNIPAEYQYAPVSTGIYPKYQIMHIGDTRLRSQCLAYDGNGDCTTPVEKNTTGFKFALLEMDNEIWGNDFAYIKTNPPASGNSLVKRGLNLSSSPYISCDYGSGLLAARYHATLGPQWYVGPPQLNENQFPYFAFTEGFQNVSYGSGTFITLYPAIGTSNPVAGGESNRSYSIDPIPLVTVKDNSAYSVKVGYEENRYPKSQIRHTLSSRDPNSDVIKNKVFGMGDVFSGKYTFTNYQEENAGYFYSGYVFKQNGINISSNEWDLLKQYSGYVIGSPSKKITYISGYTGDSTIEMNQMVAHDGSGTNVNYYYFDNRLLPEGITVKQTGWSEFSPIPTGIENTPNYGRQYAQMDIENRQRYYRGPYASYNNKFLYPNAQLESNVYRPENGFPVKFKYKIRIREETVKELYCKYQISQGTSYATPTYINVIRTPKSNFGATPPKMIKIFPDLDYNFNFNQWNINRVGYFYNSPLENSVDNDYAPYTDSYFDGITIFIAASGKNAETYKQEPTFRQGILITGDDVILHRSYSGTSYRASGHHWYTAKPKALGLYHGFTGYEITGYLNYNKPIFNLESGIIDRARTLKSLPIFEQGCVKYKTALNPTYAASGINNLYTKDLNGRIFYSKSGQDPFFFQDIGGRRGGPSATGQGGYHTKDIIGDSWIGLNAKTFGYYCSQIGVCDDNYANSVEKSYGIEALTNDNRIPNNDRRWFLINSNPNTTKIYTRGLDYNPGIYDYVNNPFKSSDVIPKMNSSGSFTFRNDIKAFYFDLASIFPSRPLTKSAEWYFNPSGSGYKIGPFDRDVEIFVDSGVTLTGYNSLYINLRKLSDYASGDSDGTASTCSAPKTIYGPTVDYGYGDYKHIRPLIYIPSGESAYINLYGMETGGYNYETPPVE
jgi:hypothetical protein